MIMTAHPALVLNADFRPMSYFPLSLLSWQDAVHAVFSDRVAVVSNGRVLATGGLDELLGTGGVRMRVTGLDDSTRACEQSVSYMTRSSLADAPQPYDPRWKK